ncbi:MAG: hypothetical protein Q4E05_10760 [Pseudoclavibacter sp.]|nr:hypothetical protein [Pseudoclavibacter sp.]
MELLFVAIFALLIGLTARFLFGHREMSGVLLTPCVCGAYAMALWVALSFLGRNPGMEWLAYDRGWIWWITLGSAAVLALALAGSIGRNRKRVDDELFDRLRHFGRSAV